MTTFVPPPSMNGSGPFPFMNDSNAVPSTVMNGSGLFSSLFINHGTDTVFSPHVNGSSPHPPSMNGSGPFPSPPMIGSDQVIDEKTQMYVWGKWTDLLFDFSKSFALKAVMELNIPNILARAGGQLTVEEIGARLPSKNVQLEYLSRIMTYASVSEIFRETSDPNMVDERTKRFALTPISAMLVEDGAKFSFAPMTRYHLSDKALEPWANLSKSVLGGQEPFHLVHGKSMWEVAEADPEWGQWVNNGMAGLSTLMMRSVIKFYKGFGEVKQLVDVGGGMGAVLASIVEAYPEISGINFDLPHVVAQAPKIPGVKHVGGDMFKRVPGGDAIFMKWILHDWSDEKCVQILKNCYQALPKSGKVILVEGVLGNPKTTREYVLDLVMLAHTSGKERSAQQWRRVLTGAGFERVNIIITPPICVIEGFKS